jgi:hypothetical protein
MAIITSALLLPIQLTDAVLESLMLAVCTAKRRQLREQD